MATTTQILYNSPALHSLKREQLVGLCKTHSIKANGKNSELIARLKQHALELGTDTFLDLMGKEGQKENRNLNAFIVQMPRPSEQWEIVMDDIKELPEPSLGTISSKGSLGSNRGNAEEFGSKNSTISSSLRTLTTSLGIKRTSSKANRTLDKHAVPYDDIPQSDALPQTDGGMLSTPDVEALKAAARQAADLDEDGDVSMSAPVPGSPSRPGAPAPANARLSMGQGPTTTIRLINNAPQFAHEAPGTPVLPAFDTQFDLILGSPNPTATPGRVVHCWPASPLGAPERLYPAVPFEDMHPLRFDVGAKAAQNMDANMPGGLTDAEATQATPVNGLKSDTPLPSKPADALDIFSPMRSTQSSALPSVYADEATNADVASTGKLALPRSEPFLFGSPLPRYSLSNKEFSATGTALVQDLMRRIEEQNKGKDQELEEKAEGFSPVAPIFTLIDAAKGRDADKPADRFTKAHEQHFGKMDSIVNHYAARRPAQRAVGALNKRKSDVLGAPPGAKRKSGAAGTRVISTGVRKKKTVPGGFGDDEDEDEEQEENEGRDEEDEEERFEDRRASKRFRVSELDDVHTTRGVTIAPSGVVHDGGVDDARRQKEREAIRRKLEANKARRRSSRGRVSIGGKAAPPKPARFGFFASAKSLVKNVLNMGATTSKPTPATGSSIPVAKPTQTTSVAMRPSVTSAAKPPTVKEPNTSSTTSAVRKPSVSAPHRLQKSKPESDLSISKGDVTMKSTSSRSSHAQSRARIPSFASPITNPATSRSTTSINTGSAASRIPSRPSSIAGASSIGTRDSLASRSQASVSSVGTRRSIVTTSAASTINNTRTSLNKDGDHMARSRTSSLMAPTASSLAKATVRVGISGRASGLPSVVEQPAKRIQRKSAIIAARASNATANSPQSQRSPRPTRIFSRPLTVDTFSSPASRNSPTPWHSSLAGVAAALASPSRIPRVAIPPKPKGLVARRPRISRTRVIAKLGEQRGGAGQPAPAPAVLAPAARTRSSVGARKSLGGVKAGRASAGGEAAKLAAKKRARQSEYARRRSRASGGRKFLGPSAANDDAMNVDD